jgi:hypothetical protein
MEAALAVDLRNRRSEVRILSGALENPDDHWGFWRFSAGLNYRLLRITEGICGCGTAAAVGARVVESGRVLGTG